MSSSDRTPDTNDDILDFPLQLSKICLSSIRDDNTLISPFAIEAALQTLSSPEKSFNNRLKNKIPFDFYNYFILDDESVISLRKDLNEETINNFNTEFQIHSLTDIQQRKTIINQLLKRFSEQAIEPIVPSQKVLAQIIVKPLTLVSCSSLKFRPLKSEHWEQLWSLKFHSNPHLSLETEFYFTKGFFRVAFHDTFHKIEIPGQIYHGIQMKLIILLPRCSSDLVHLYANIKEYLNLPFTSAFIGVCIPKITMDIDMNLIEALKHFTSLYNLDDLGDFTEQIHLSAAHFLGHFNLDISTEKVPQSSSSSCLHSIDLSPVTPWVFFANRPFLFLITYGNDYLLVGQMLGPKIRQERSKFLAKSKDQI